MKGVFMAVDNKYLDDTIKTIRSRKNMVKGMKQFDAGTFEKKEKTIQDVLDTMNEEQKNVVYALVGMVIKKKN
jgi:uncharacterized protein HemY